MREKAGKKENIYCHYHLSVCGHHCGTDLFHEIKRRFRFGI